MLSGDDSLIAEECVNVAKLGSASYPYGQDMLISCRLSDSYQARNCKNFELIDTRHKLLV